MSSLASYHLGIGHSRRWVRSRHTPVLALVAASLLLAAGLLAAQDLELRPPLHEQARSERFGEHVLVLDNDLVVAVDSGFDHTDFRDDIADVGIVRVYRRDGALLGRIRGGQVGDSIGSGGVLALPGGRFLIRSSGWSGGRGAVTVIDSASLPPTLIVSEQNSIVGRVAGDFVGASPPTLLPNGRVVLPVPNWNRPGQPRCGAVVVFDAAGPIPAFAVDESNSIHGLRGESFVGFSDIVELPGSRFVIGSPSWRNAANISVGASTWVDGNAVLPIAFAVSAENSLVGSFQHDQVHQYALVLANGNYLIASPNKAAFGLQQIGAVTFGRLDQGVSGEVGVHNSLIGPFEFARLGEQRTLQALANGSYVVTTDSINASPVFSYSAATWGDGEQGTLGQVSPANSLVRDLRAQAGSARTEFRVVPLADGDYVVLDPMFAFPTTREVGALQVGLGSGGSVGAFEVTSVLRLPGGGIEADDTPGLAVAVLALDDGSFALASPRSEANGAERAGAVWHFPGAPLAAGELDVEQALLTGANGSDFLASGFLFGGIPSQFIPGLVAVPGGRFLVLSPQVDFGELADVGAVSLVDPSSPPVPARVGPENSTLGAAAQDRIGSGGAVLLPDASLVLGSPHFDGEAGAVTRWQPDQAAPVTVAADNSLVGGNAGDLIGKHLSRVGDEVLVCAPTWARPDPISHTGNRPGAGAAVLIGVGSAVLGTVGPDNALVGANQNDHVCDTGAESLGDGVVLMRSTQWRNVGAAQAGAVTLIGGAGAPRSGSIGVDNSLTGAFTSERLGLTRNRVAVSTARDLLVAGSPFQNRVLLRDFGPATSLFSDGFE